MKKIFFVMFIMLCFLTFVSCGKKSKAKEGYSLRKEEQIKYYVANGLNRDDVKYSNCSYVIVKSENETRIYYKANYTLTYSSTSQNSLIDYFEWVEGASYTSVTNESVFEEMLSKVKDKTLDGDIGELKK